MVTKPKIVCLCGSTRFSEAFQKAQFEETLAGKIVLTIGSNMKSDTELFKDYSENELKEIIIRLDELHRRKIDLADEGANIECRRLHWRIHQGRTGICPKTPQIDQIS